MQREVERAPAGENVKRPAGLNSIRVSQGEVELGAYQPQFEQLGDDPVEHPSVVLLVYFVGNLLDDILSSQRGAVNLPEAFWVICEERPLMSFLSAPQSRIIFFTLKKKKVFLIFGVSRQSRVTNVQLRQSDTCITAPAAPRCPKLSENEEQCQIIFVRVCRLNHK